MFLVVPSLCVSATLRKPPRPSDCNLPKCALSSRQYGHGDSPSTDQGESYVQYAGKKEKVRASENGKAERERKAKKGERREKENILSNKKQNTCKTSNKGMHLLSDTKI